MSEKIDLIYDIVKDLDDKVDRLDEKFDNHRVKTEHRMTCVESDIKLKTRIGGAVAAGLPALGTLAYLLFRFLT